MSNINEIKNRIKGVRDTQKITNAMYLISSQKLQRARAALDNTRPYFDAVHNEITGLLERADVKKSRYLTDTEEETAAPTACACLIITADKGLAGAYNRNLLHAAEAFNKNHPSVCFYSLGEYGRRALPSIGMEINPDFLYPSTAPTLDTAREITGCLLEAYDSGRFAEIYILYTNMKTALQEEVLCERLLPLERSRFSPGEIAAADFEYHPSLEKALDQLIQNHLFGYIFGALTDSFCSEQNARMRAMSTANDNAEELLAELSVTYNRLRQAAITQEITEVSAGARAQQSK